MKLAEALQERADLNTHIQQLSSRLNANALYQENTEPAENPAELLQELNTCCTRLAELITAINLANSRITINGKTLTQLIAEKDVLTQKLGTYRQLLSEASRPTYRARNTEIRILSSVDVRALQKEVDTMARQLRTLNNTLQAANWSEEL